MCTLLLPNEIEGQIYSENESNSVVIVKHDGDDRELNYRQGFVVVVHLAQG